MTFCSMSVTVVQSVSKLSGNWTTRLSGEILRIDDDKKMRVGRSIQVRWQFVTLYFLLQEGVSYTHCLKYTNLSGRF